MSINAEWVRDEIQALQADNAALRELLREWVIGWGGFNSADLKPGGLVIRTRAALKGEKP